MSASLSQVVAFYERKTDQILQRYGPGPRVHYHTGLAQRLETCAADSSELRQLLIASQERLLSYAAAKWRIEFVRGQEFLDVGCGLGGGALFWAQEFGARVTALTIIPSHAELVRQFAIEARVEKQVTTMICDAAEVTGERLFDSIMAIDSSSSFPRSAWFRRAFALLRPGGKLFIADCFLREPEYEAAFNSHWCAQIGTVTEYLDAAHAAGLRLASFEDVSPQAENFWSLSIALMAAQKEHGKAERTASAPGRDSQVMHSMVRRGLATGGLRHLLLSFVKCDNWSLETRADSA
ncbi:MAG TPA: class I SAM-dependent methyltransferase [Candidatus Binataceae bacterium]|nr:class I SAM-dependent methyltransferase [Candidatus Binataceae bacterium]